MAIKWDLPIIVVILAVSAWLAMAGLTQVPPREPFYESYLAGREQLGFVADRKWYEAVHDNIRRSYVHPIADADLLRGAQDEVRTLLGQAHVDASEPIEPATLVQTYGAKVDPKLLWLAMGRGELQVLHDPRCSLMLPTECRLASVDMVSYEVGGVGVYIDLDETRDDRITILQTVEGSPAAAAGLKGGDVLLSVNGKSMSYADIGLATMLIRGPVGTSVRLRVWRPSKGEFDTTMRRASYYKGIHVTGVLLERCIGYVRIFAFGEKTAQEFRQAVQGLTQRGMRSLILDLRGNTGAYLTTASDVASLLLPAGTSMVTVAPREESIETYRTSNQGPVCRSPLVVLVNHHTGRAAEVLAGCLQDHHRATILGTGTMGTAAVQQLFYCRNQQWTGLALTTACFSTPDGHVITGNGIQPDVEVPDEDQQLSWALALLRSPG